MKKIILLATVLLVFAMFGCKKDKGLDAGTCSVSDEKVETIGSSANISGSFVSTGTVENMIIVYGTAENLESAISASCTLEGQRFSVDINDLSSNTKYFYCFEFSNKYSSVKTGVKSFQTLAAAAPTVVTGSVSDITQTSAVCGGEVTDDGGAPVTARGVCYGQQPNPTIAETHTVDSCGLGIFVSNITGLLKNTKYYVRAYATNEKGTNYGVDMEFTTSALSPSVRTVSVTDVSENSARVSCEVVSDGGSALLERGVCYSIHQNPTLEDEHLAVGNGVGLFTANVTGLNPSTKYYIRAYAKNGSGLGFGEVLEFTTTNIMTVPSVSTVEIKNVTALSATAVGNVSSDGGAAITTRGFCWSKTANPTIQNSHVEVSGTTGVFEGSLSNLEANVTYHVRAYATNSKGTGYGDDMTFTTMEGLPVVTTSSVTEITATSAKCGGNVTSQGGSNVTERGICWSTSHNPTMSNSHASGGSGTGSFTAQMTGLTPGKIYYVRAYAKNTQGVTYGSEVEFTTTATMPSVTTGNVTAITQTTATGSGNVTSDGGSSVIERGICWSTTANPTTGNSHASNGSGTGNFSAGMTGLTAGTTYHVRAYATNSAGTAYGNDVTFTTEATLPTVTTSQVSNITQTTAQGGGNVTSDGGANVTERGVCWSLNANPTTSDSHATSGTGTGGFTANMTGLTANTTYHVRAYAKNSQGTSYGSDVIFTTSQSISAPTVTTSTVTTITQTTAVGGGNVTSDGGANVTERGICWGTSQNPTTNGTHSSSGSGTGSFTVQMSGLTANTTYYVRAYATNSAGTSYGEQKSFTTLQNIVVPTVTTNNVTDITQTTATGGGNVTSDGGATVTARGVCWSTSSNPTTSNSHTTNGSGTGTFTSSITGLSANTTYYVRAYATNSVGTNYGEQKSFKTNGSVGGHEFVDLGLPSGLLWATCNVGADSPEDYGDYFAWGEIEPYYADGHSQDNPCSNWRNMTTGAGNTDITGYDWHTYSQGGSNYFVEWATPPYNSSNVLKSERDAANVNWGGDWRMATKEEWQELFDNTTSQWTTQNGVNGRLFTNTLSGNTVVSLFLPAAGRRYGTPFYDAGSRGIYWSSSLETPLPRDAYLVVFSSDYVYPPYHDLRDGGFSVRPVR